MADFLPQSFSAKFDQEYKSAIKGNVKKGHGQVEYKFPGLIRFETLKPTHVLYITNSKKAWYYTYPFMEGEKGELTETSAKEGQVLFTKFFDALKKGLVTNNLYRVEKTPKGQLLVFLDKSKKEIGLRSALIQFTSGSEEFKNISAMELEFLDGKKSLMTLSDVKINPEINDSRFEFKEQVNQSETVKK